MINFTPWVQAIKNFLAVADNEACEVSMLNVSTDNAFQGAHRSDPLRVMRATDGALELTAPRHNVFDAATSRSHADRDSYLATLAALLSAGVVGAETLNVNGQPYTRFAELAIGDDQHRGVPQYRRYDARA